MWCPVSQAPCKQNDRMQVYTDLSAYRAGAHPAATIGTFDGVHLGHQVILQRLLTLAHQHQGETVVVSFHPHPRQVLQPHDTSLRLLQTIDEKIAVLRSLGIDKLLLVPFTPAFAQLTADEFMQQILVDTLHVEHLLIGYDHRFGRDRSGGLPELRAKGQQFGFSVEEIPAQQIDDANISSTKIRDALLAGDVAQAARLLGRPYSLSGGVVQGDQRGRQMGYPTANIQVPDAHKLLPANGVYAVWVTLPDGSRYPAMLNAGNRPTVDGIRYAIEAHLFDFQGDLYGKSLEVAFVERLRNEQRFPSLEALIAQLAVDAVAARAVLLS